MVDCCLSDEGDGVEADPLPEDDVVGHVVSLHLGLHLDVEDLEGLTGLQRNHLGGWVHDGRVGGDGSPGKKGAFVIIDKF